MNGYQKFFCRLIRYIAGSFVQEMMYWLKNYPPDSGEVKHDGDEQS